MWRNIDCFGYVFIEGRMKFFSKFVGRKWGNPRQICNAMKILFSILYINIFLLFASCGSQVGQEKKSRPAEPYVNTDGGLLQQADSTMAALYFAGDFKGALAAGDSAIKSDFFPDRYTPEWADFMNDYAFMLQGAGRHDEAIALMKEIIAKVPAGVPQEHISRMVSLAEFNLNYGRLSEAKENLSEIDMDMVSDMPEALIKINLIAGVIAYGESRAIPVNLMHNTAKQVEASYQRAQLARQEAQEKSNRAEQEKMRLDLQRQRLWIVIVSLLLVIVAGAWIVRNNLRRKRERIMSAEERAETLDRLLRLAKSEKSADKSETVRRLIVGYLGILKTFAVAPTQQNQDALRRISGVEHSGGTEPSIVDWDKVYLLIDELYDGYCSSIRNRYGTTFTEKEIQIIMLLKAGFSTKEIGVLTELSANSIYVRKTAIRKKLGIDDGGDFMAVLDV